MPGNVLGANGNTYIKQNSCLEIINAFGMKQKFKQIM